VPRPKKSLPPPPVQQRVLSFVKKWWWAVLLLLLPALYLGYKLYYNGVNVPFWDEWEMVPIFQKHDAGTLTLYDFWSQHNEHRLFFPQLLIYGMAFLTHWNLKFEVVINFLLAGGSFVLIADMIRRTFASTKLRFGLAMLASALFFSPMQWENWLWGWQIEWYMVVLAIIATVWILCFWPQSEKWARWKYPAAIATAIIATYSLGSGPFVWFIGAGLLLLAKTPRRYLYVWGGAAAVTLISHYYHYSSSAGQPSKALALHEPLNFFAYITSYLGRPLAFHIIMSMIIGGLLLLAAAWVVYQSFRKRHLIPKLLPWYGVAAFAGFSAFTTTLSRLGYGVGQGFASRYMTISLLFTIGVIAMVLIVAQEYPKIRQRQTALLVALLLLVGLVVWNYKAGVHAMETHSQYLRDIKNCSHQDEPSEICLMSAYPNAERVKKQIDYLKDKHWGGYTGQPLVGH
jgi:hypothetical protein